MKNSALLILLISLLMHCKDKDKQPAPLPEVAGIVSKWKMTSYEYKRGDSTIIEAPTGGVNIIAFRYDGVPVDSLGQGLCCPPSSYLLNGQVFEIKQIGDAPPYNTQCSFVDCISCAQWKLTQEGDRLTIELCRGATKSNYERIK